MSKRRGAATSSLALAANSVPGASKNISRRNRCSSISTRHRSDGIRFQAKEKKKMSTIQIKTEIPGPKSRALMARREAAIPRGPSNATPVFAARADGATIEDVDGNRYLDFAGGIGCLNIGHRSPRVISAIQAQLEKHLHRSEEHTSELQSRLHLVC